MVSRFSAKTVSVFSKNATTCVMEEEWVDYWRPKSANKCSKIYFSDVRSRKTDFFEKLKKQNENIEQLNRVSKGFLKNSILILALDEGSYLESFCDQLKNVEVLPIYPKRMKKKLPLEISNKEHIVVRKSCSYLIRLEEFIRLGNI